MSADPSLRTEHRDGWNVVTQLRPALVKYFKRKTGSAAEAEDLAQDVLVNALSHAMWESPAHAKGYIFRAAVNRWRDRCRRLQARGVNVEWDEAAAQEMGAQNQPERVLIAEDELKFVIQALRDLEPRTRTVLMLIKLEQMKIASVAAMLGISVRAVNRHLAKALSSLAQARNMKDRNDGI
jgi:RNA polymerase sigma factor (sigma-70 family)